MVVVSISEGKRIQAVLPIAARQYTRSVSIVHPPLETRPKCLRSVAGNSAARTSPHPRRAEAP